MKAITQFLYEIDFQEKATRKAVVVTVLFTILFYFLAVSETLGYFKEGSMISTVIFGAITFIVGLIGFRTLNPKVVFLYPAWYLIAIFATPPNVWDLFYALPVSFMLTLFGYSALLKTLEWVRKGD